MLIGSSFAGAQASTLDARTRAKATVMLGGTLDPAVAGLFTIEWR